MYPFMSKVLIKVDVIHRQQVPPRLLFARPRVKVKDKSNHDHNIQKYIANIKIIPKHYSQVGYVALANICPWAVEKWNSSRSEVIFPGSYLSNLKFFKVFTKGKNRSLLLLKWYSRSLNGVSYYALLFLQLIAYVELR